MQIADELELDLVEISPSANPPVCKVIDYSKFLYQLKKKEKEQKRQQNNIELIASENYVSKDILKLQGSVLTNKYAEGYSSKRYYASFYLFKSSK